MNAVAKVVADASAAFIDEHPGVVAAPDRILGWAEHAKPGSQFIYASRCYLPAGSKGAECARDLAARGILHLKQRKIDDGRAINYIAERSSAPWSQSRDRPRSPSPKRRDVSDEAAAIDALLPLLQRAARFNRPCPTDAQLAQRARIAVTAVQPALDALKDSGVIRVVAFKAPTLRLITIVATGHRTGIVG